MGITRRANPICDILALSWAFQGYMTSIFFNLATDANFFLLRYKIPRKKAFPRCISDDGLSSYANKVKTDKRKIIFFFFGTGAIQSFMYNLYLFRGSLDICLLAIKASGKNFIWPSSPSTNRNFSCSLW